MGSNIIIYYKKELLLNILCLNKFLLIFDSYPHEIISYINYIYIFLCKEDSIKIMVNYEKHNNSKFIDCDNSNLFNSFIMDINIKSPIYKIDEIVRKRFKLKSNTMLWYYHNENELI